MHVYFCVAPFRSWVLEYQGDLNTGRGRLFVQHCTKLWVVMREDPATVARVAARLFVLQTSGTFTQYI